MTNCAEILTLAAEKPPLEARALLLGYEQWWRRRGDNGREKIPGDGHVAARWWT